MRVREETRIWAALPQRHAQRIEHERLLRHRDRPT